MQVLEEIEKDRAVAGVGLWSNCLHFITQKKVIVMRSQDTRVEMKETFQA